MDNTFIIPIIRTDLIERCLETLYRYTPPNFYTYIIDQTADGIDANKLREQYRNLMVIRTPKTLLHHTGNLGFAQATNLGIKLVQTKYFTMCNDDVEFVNRGWWWGTLEAFDKVNEATPDRPCMMVNPGSIKLPDWSVGRPKGDDFFIKPYKPKYSQEDYDDLVNGEHYVNEHLTLMPGSVIDGVTMYCSVFETDKFLEVGYLDEKFYPGGGEDYDYNCRANMFGYRCVGTTMSWVFHHWSMTMEKIEEEKVRALVQTDIRWNNNNEKWGENFDVWGMKDQDKDQIPPITVRPL